MVLPFKKYQNSTFYISQNYFSQNETKIPLQIWQTWKTKELPPSINNSVELLKLKHPDFTHNLFDDQECYDFILQHFNKELADVYNALIPGAYKSDLWRLCVLYIHGGIYMDIKLEFISDYSLYNFIDKEYYVFDGGNNIYNAFMISEPGNKFLLESILNIVHNVANNFYGNTPWEPTGPGLIGKYYDWSNKPYFTHYGPKQSETVHDNENNIILKHCDNYREEQELLKTEYYFELWNTKSIYSNNSFDYNQVKEQLLNKFN